MEFDPELIVPDKSKSILEGALVPWGEVKGKYLYHILKGLSDFYDFSLDTPFVDLKTEFKDIILYGSGEVKIPFKYKNDERNTYWLHENYFEGVVNNLKRRYRETKSEYIRSEIQKFMTIKPCPACKGKRLRPESLKVTIDGFSIVDLAEQSVKQSYNFFENIKLHEREKTIAGQILKEIKNRLGFLINVGLDYLTLSRASSTLAGGENQRIRLATQIGSSLTGVLYILDEPSIGLHQKDNYKLLQTLLKLRNLGNTVIVIEHDEATMKIADYIVDLGPGAGLHGGYVVARGSCSDIMKNKESITGKYLSHFSKINIPFKRREGNGKYLKVYGARQYNLKKIDVSIPLGTFTCVTGVSGSGKSTLVEETLYKALVREIYKTRIHPGDYDKIE
jgi:excinuclease ABC subunit A